jgi:hypothetical protein
MHLLLKNNSHKFDIMKKIFKTPLSFLILFLFAFQSSESKPKTEAENEKKEITPKYKKRDLDETRTAKFDNDDLPDSFMLQKNSDEDEIAQYILSVSLSSLKKEIKINVLNNSILYNNNKSTYHQSFKFINDKICEVTIEYPNQKSIPNMSGEKKNLIEKIKYRFDNQNHKIQVIGYHLSYQKGTKFITKSFNFVTGKYIAVQKNNGKNSTASGWSAELENIYAKDWNFPFVRDKIFWYGEEVE